MPPRQRRHFCVLVNGSAWNPKNHILPAFRSLLGRNWQLFARARNLEQRRGYQADEEGSIRGRVRARDDWFVVECSGCQRRRNGQQLCNANAVSAAIDVDRIRSVLKLTPEQERYWRPVEAALRDLARHQQQPESDGFVHRVSRRLVRSCSTARPSSGLAVAARPLIAKLDDRAEAGGRPARTGNGPRAGGAGGAELDATGGVPRRLCRARKRCGRRAGRAAISPAGLS